VLAKLGSSITAGRPYVIAFVDVCTRRTGDFDPAEVITDVWQVCPDLPVVVCNGCSDLAKDVVLAAANRPDQISFLRKPFSPVEVRHATRYLLRPGEGVNPENRPSAVHLAAGIAHEFNIIFSTIHGHATMALMRLGHEGEHAQSMVEIRRATERGAEMVRRLLALDNCGPVQMRQVKLASVVQSLESRLRGLAGSSIQLELAADAQVSPILADRSLVEQLILNLAVNARDAMPDGGRLRLGLTEIVPTDEELAQWPDARPGRFVRLEIGDSGRGMHPEVLKQLSDPRASSPTSGKRIGLGLTSVLHTITRHQGWFSVRADPGRGTCFQVHFPVVAE
jgi:signal transduction histidine kinase